MLRAKSEGCVNQQFMIKICEALHMPDKVYSNESLMRTKLSHPFLDSSQECITDKNLRVSASLKSSSSQADHYQNRLRSVGKFPLDGYGDNRPLVTWRGMTHGNNGGG